MSSTASADPRILLPAEVLCRGNGLVVWHGGLVQGANRLALTLMVESDPAGQGNEALSGKEWEAFGPLGPAGIALRGPDSPGFFVPYADTMRGPGFYRTTAFFDIETLGDANLEFFVRPLDQHLVRFLGEAPSAEPLPMLVDPEVLHDDGGYTLWHLGAVQGPHGVISAMETRADGTGDHDLMGPGWQLGDRPDDAPVPLDIQIQSASHQASETAAHGEIVGGDRSLRRHCYLPGRLTSTTQLIYRAPALGIVAARSPGSS